MNDVVPMNLQTVAGYNPTTGYLSKGNKIGVSKRCSPSHVHHVIIHNSKNIESIRVHVNRRMEV